MSPSFEVVIFLRGVNINVDVFHNYCVIIVPGSACADERITRYIGENVTFPLESQTESNFSVKVPSCSNETYFCMSCCNNFGRHMCLNNGSIEMVNVSEKDSGTYEFLFGNKSKSFFLQVFGKYTNFGVNNGKYKSLFVSLLDLHLSFLFQKKTSWQLTNIQYKWAKRSQWKGPILSYVTRIQEESCSIKPHQYPSSPVFCFTGTRCSSDHPSWLIVTDLLQKIVKTT